MAITAVPFTIDVPQEQIDDLRDRLARTRWADDFLNESWDYGVERGWLREMTAYWRDDYDWREHEAAMNAYPNFRVQIDDVPVHFMHIRGKGPDPTPIIITHGWPWAYWDMRRMIGPLTDPAAHGGDPRDSFDVVIPSIPGFGWSIPLRAPMSVRKVGDLWTALMRDVLGYDRFAAYGGDWGSVITAELGHAHAEHLIGVSLSLSMLPDIDYLSVTADAFAPDEQWMPARMAEAERLVRTHMTLQATDPQTLAYALSDSPVGLAAWIWGRWRAWSDCDGDVLSIFSRDDLATRASIYWFTDTMTTSMRMYWDHFNRPRPLAHDRQPAVEAPTAFAVFPKDLTFLPRAMAAGHSNLHRWTIMPRGGHFAPAEQPDLMAAEVRAFFADLRRSYAKWQDEGFGAKISSGFGD